MATVHEINDIKALDTQRNQWRHLLGVTPEAQFFQSLEWLEVYWKHFKDDQRLRVVLIEDRDELIGIVPLAVRRIETKLGHRRILTYPFDDWGTFYGPIAADPGDALCQALKHIRETTWDWDLIDLRCIHRDGTDGGATEQAMADAGFDSEELGWDAAAFVDLQQDWDEYLAGRRGKDRRTYQRSERNIANEGTVEYTRYRPAGEQHGDGDPRWDLYDACEQIAQHSWQGASTDGTTLSHDSIRDYLRDTHEAAARFGAADVNLIYLQGIPAAFAYNYHFQGAVYSLRVGFNPDISNKGLGRLVMGRLIHDGMQRGDRFLDMGVGSLKAKQCWLTSIERSYRYVYYSASSPAAQLLKLSHQVAGWYRRCFGGSDSHPAFDEELIREVQGVTTAG